MFFCAPPFITTAGAVTGPWTLASAAYEKESPVLEANPGVFRFSSSGKKLYVVNVQSLDQYSLARAWDVSTASYDGVTYDLATYGSGNYPQFISFSDDGTLLYETSYNSDTAYQHELSTPWDLSTASESIYSKSLSALGTNPIGMIFKSDGLVGFIGERNSKVIYGCTTTVAWNVFQLSVTTGTSNKFTVSEVNGIQDFWFGDSGTKLYVLSAITDIVYQYTLSTAWDLTTASYDSISVNNNSYDAGTVSMTVAGNGSKLYFSGTVGDKIYQYDL